MPDDNTSPRWTVEYVDTESLSPLHHAQAVAALSQLIAQWEQQTGQEPD